MIYIFLFNFSNLVSYNEVHNKLHYKCKINMCILWCVFWYCWMCLLCNRPTNSIIHTYMYMCNMLCIKRVVHPIIRTVLHRRRNSSKTGTWKRWKKLPVRVQKSDAKSQHGQHKLWQDKHARCDRCTHCTDSHMLIYTHTANLHTQHNTHKHRGLMELMYVGKDFMRHT